MHKLQELRSNVHLSLLVKLNTKRESNLHIFDVSFLLNLTELPLCVRRSRDRVRAVEDFCDLLQAVAASLWEEEVRNC